jgi:hypothetical protein
MEQTLNKQIGYNYNKGGYKMNKILNKEKDKCYYCDEVAAYWDQNGATIISVCKKHAINYYAG